MTRLRTGAALAVTMIAALSGTAAAQFTPSPPPGAPPSTVQNRWPDPPKPSQSEPAQAQPAVPKQPAQARTSPAKPSPKVVASPSGSAVTCNGVFAKDANHIRLAMKYDSRNVVFGEIEGPDGSKLPGSIVFPNDPKRRLEVLWNNEAARSGTSVIAINGQSQWIGPKGLKLGMPIQAVEKMNGRAFKISGFAADGSASVLGWEGGALSSLPGGCKVGIRLIGNAQAPQDVRDTIGGDKELISSDANVRAVSPAVAEILIGY